MNHGATRVSRPGFLELFFQSNLTLLGVKCHPICVGSWIAANAGDCSCEAAKEVNLSERQFGVGVSGGAELLGSH